MRRERGKRTAESKKEKRKRYRIRKKAQYKVMLSATHMDELLQKNLCKRWAQREKHSNEVERIEEAETLLMDHLEKKQMEERMLEKQREQQEKEEHNSEVQRKYRVLAQEALYSETDSLLLPDISALSNADEIPVKTADSSVKQALKDALCQVQSYRNLAERLQREKRELKHQMEEKTEVVVDFWRNKLLEGSSRAGKMVKCALQKKSE